SGSRWRRARPCSRHSSFRFRTAVTERSSRSRSRSSAPEIGTRLSRSTSADTWRFWSATCAAIPRSGTAFILFGTTPHGGARRLHNRARRRPMFVPTSLPLLVVALAAQAATPIDRLPQNAAGNAVRRAIGHAGGWSAWEAKKTAELKKGTRSLRPDGSVAETRSEGHRYRLRPGFGVRVGTGTTG